MSLPKCKDFTDYNKYPGEENPTTDAQMQEYMDNQNQIVKAASTMMWQPSTEYVVGDVIVSPSMPALTEAICTVAGMTDSAVEPSWRANATIADGTCFWRVRYAYHIYSGLEQLGLDATASEIDILSAMSVGSMCCISVTTANSPNLKILEYFPDVGAYGRLTLHKVSSGGGECLYTSSMFRHYYAYANITSGLVAWRQVFDSAGGELTGNIRFNNGADSHIYKTATDGRMIIHGGSSAFADGASAYFHGKDHASAPGQFNFYVHDGTNSNQLNGRPDGKLLWGDSDISNPIKNASISGKVITLTFANNTTKTLTTQDTAPFTARATAIGGASTTKPAVVVATDRNGANGYRVWSDGFIEQWGTTENVNADSTVISLNKAFTTTQYHFNFIVAGYAKDDSYGHMVTAKTTSTVTIQDWLMNNVPVTWYACGV